MLRSEDLRALAEIEGEHVVSLYVPTETAGRETRQNPIRFKNLLERATRELVEDGCRRPDAQALLAPAIDLVDDHAFWQHQRHGLAAFAAPGFFRCERLPIEAEETVVVGRRLHLKPLLPLMAEGERFRLLAVSAARARLRHCTRFGWSAVAADLPQGVEEIAAETDYDEGRHATPPARPRVAEAIAMPGTHAYGEAPEEQRKTQLLHYLQRVASTVEKHEAGDRTPFVLVAQAAVQGHLRAFARGTAFVEGGIETDPEALDDAELHARARKLAEPILQTQCRQDLDRFTRLHGAGDPRAVTVPDDVMRMARDGRIEALLLARGQALWGRFDEARDVVEAHATRAAGDEDLLDRAAVRTLLHGGRIAFVAPDALPPTGVLMAAILRY